MSVEVVLDGAARCNQRREDISNELSVDWVISIREVILDTREVCDNHVVRVALIDAGVGSVLVPADFRDR